MLAAVEMLGGVLAARLVAAANMAATAADAQMEPFPAQRQAFLAAFAARCHRLDGIKMRTKIIGHFIQPLPVGPAPSADAPARHGWPRPRSSPRPPPRPPA